MGLKKLIAENIKETRELKEVLSKDGIKKIKEYDNLMNQISSLQSLLTITVAPTIDENGKTIIKLLYKCNIPTQIIEINDDGVLVVPEIVKNINLLNIISIDDMNKISKSIDTSLNGYFGKKNKESAWQKNNSSI